MNTNRFNDKVKSAVFYVAEAAVAFSNMIWFTVIVVAIAVIAR